MDIRETVYRARIVGLDHHQELLTDARVCLQACGGCLRTQIRPHCMDTYLFADTNLVCNRGFEERHEPGQQEAKYVFNDYNPRQYPGRYLGR
jgi:hypothetical protein